jgi:alanyl-tRNA synthetase
MTGDELRKKYLFFFEQKGHKVIPSSSLIPHGDPTLLLTSAGMVQFKPYFTGEQTPPSPRLASCQKCFRTTDITSVGNFKHLTFFEMLGNFSIGDYFKREAIGWAWEFVLDWLKIPQEKLWVTIFLDDDESFGYWQDIGVRAERIVRCGEKDNFWGPAGETGPCGPCSEIHYDFGAEYACGPDCSPSCGCGRFLEIWNLVFTEFYQDANKKRTPLPRKNIDTGMGLERTATVIQGKRSFYDTDLFAPIMKRVSELTGSKYGDNEKTDRAMRIVAEHGRAVTFLITDGVIPSNEGRGYVLRRILRRAMVFGNVLGLDKPFLTDVAEVVIVNMGHVYPELIKNRNPIFKVIKSEEEKFGDILSKGLRILGGVFSLKKHAAEKAEIDLSEKIKLDLSRASLVDETQLSKLRESITEDFFSELQFKLMMMATDDSLVIKYPEEILGRNIALSEMQGKLGILQDRVKKLGATDIEQDLQNILDKLWAIFGTLTGNLVFQLYDTYGFPPELTIELAIERGFLVDQEGFEAEMENQRERARAAHKFVQVVTPAFIPSEEKVFQPKIVQSPATEFVGYQKSRCQSSILRLGIGGKEQREVREGQQVNVILERTPFYADMGGQVGDTGKIVGKNGIIIVENTVWANKEIIVHVGKVAEGVVFQGEKVTAEVDRERRLDIARNHTATHLLHSALRNVLGSHVHQSGSLVTPDRFRFDFTFEAPVLKEELSQIQRIVNENIRRNLPVNKKEMPYTEAVAEGAIALFGEKYGDVVRTVRVGLAKSPVSFEVCGGTHIDRTGDISLFQIVSEGSIGSGLRRIEAVTGRGAEKLVEERASTLEKIAQQLQVPVASVENKIVSTLEELDSERKRAIALERQLSKETADSLLGKVESVKGVSVLSVDVPASNMDALRHTGDILREKLGSGVIVLAGIWDGKPNFLAMVTPDLVNRGLNAGEIVKKVAQATGGSGGGRPQLGQGGGKDTGKLEEALKLVARLVEEKVQG